MLQPFSSYRLDPKSAGFSSQDGTRSANFKHRIRLFVGEAVTEVTNGHSQIIKHTLPSRPLDGGPNRLTVDPKRIVTRYLIVDHLQ